MVVNKIEVCASSPFESYAIVYKKWCALHRIAFFGVSLKCHFVLTITIYDFLASVMTIVSLSEMHSLLFFLYQDLSDNR